MAVWLCNSVPLGSAESLISKTTGKSLNRLRRTYGSQSMMMVCERGEKDDFVYIWLAEDSWAGSFPEFKPSAKPKEKRPLAVLAERHLYARHFPREKQLKPPNPAPADAMKRQGRS
jgi:hypothetical protein